MSKKGSPNNTGKSNPLWPTKNGSSNPSGGGRGNNPPKGK